MIKRTILLLLSFIVFFAFWFFIIVSVFKYSTLSPDYFVSLRENSVQGCSTLDGRKLDYLILGDSHTYSAFDFVALSEKLSTRNIQMCAMGGFYFESMIHFLQNSVKIIEHTKTIIYGLSYRQFTNGENKDNQILEHNKILSTLNAAPEFNLDSMYVKINDFLSFKRNDSIALQYKENIFRWMPLLLQTDDKKITALYEKLSNKSKKSWEQYLKTASIESDTFKKIDLFCQIIKEKKINFILVDVPESPFLQKMYSDLQNQQYITVIENLKKCAYSYVSKEEFSSLRSNRYYVNRTLNPLWPTQFESHEFSQPKDIDNAYDLDHMNPVGASVFTDILSKKLLQLKENRAL